MMRLSNAAGLFASRKIPCLLSMMLLCSTTAIRLDAELDAQHGIIFKDAQEVYQSDGRKLPDYSESILGGSHTCENQRPCDVLGPNLENATPTRRS